MPVIVEPTRAGAVAGNLAVDPQPLPFYLGVDCAAILHTDHVTSVLRSAQGELESPTVEIAEWAVVCLSRPQGVELDGGIGLSLCDRSVDLPDRGRRG